MAIVSLAIRESGYARMVNLQSMDPATDIERLAFDHYAHNSQFGDGPTGALIVEFLARYINLFAEDSRDDESRARTAGELALSIYDYAFELIGEYPQGIEETLRRKDMWRACIIDRYPISTETVAKLDETWERNVAIGPVPLPYIQV